MKKLLSLLMAALLLLPVLPHAGASGASYAGKTVILYTGNVRGDVDLYAQVKAAHDRYESAGAEVILADAGNFLQGRSAANTDRGLSVYRLMDAAGYDVAAMGLAEFGYADATTGFPYHGNVTRYYTQAELQNGAEALTYARNRDGSVTADRPAKGPALFQTLSANASSGQDYYSFVPSLTLVTHSGLSLAFYGLTDPAAADSVQDGCLSVSAPALPQLPQADLVVCLSNAGVSGKSYGDIVIDAPTGGETVVGAWVIDEQTKDVRREEVSLSGSDPELAAMAAQVRVDSGTPAATSQVILNGSDRANRNGETNLGDLVTDALVWYAQHSIDGLDHSLPLVAIQNGGNCDAFLYTGDLTDTDLLRALPFSPMGVGVIYLSGAQLLETLEAADQCEDCPGFAQVSGLRYVLNTGEDYDGGAAYGKFYEADSVHRVTITEVNGQPFDLDATYAVVCDNYLINGNDTYYTLANAKGEGAEYLNNGSGVLTRDIVRRYIQDELGGTVDERYARPQGRISVVDGLFSDVSASSYYFAPVSWAVSQGITQGSGEGTFSPADTCTRAQAVTFLWRAAGSPAPTSRSQPFTDVPANAYYRDAVLWAVEQEITSGVGNSLFDPAAPVSRAQVVTFLWRFAGKPGSQAGGHFFDVPAQAYYARAVAWAVEQGVTQGSGENSFSPDTPCSRAQIVTFLYRQMAG